MEKVVDHAKIDYIRMKNAKSRKSEVHLEDLPEQSYEQDFRLTPSDEFDFAEEKLAECFSQLPLMRRRILTLLFVERRHSNE
jgi:hypothetical protein